MRETVRSLRIYLILAGALGVYQCAVRVAASNTPLLVMLLLAAGLNVGLLYIGIRLRDLLIDSPTTINTVLYANVGFCLILFLLGLVAGAPGAVVSGLISLLILLYIIRNVRRLAAETLHSATNPGVS